jgi:hypothetical protein
MTAKFFLAAAFCAIPLGAFAQSPNTSPYWASRTDFPGTLIWQPIFAFAAAAGDLGYTTGLWELKKGNDQPSLGYGHYVTIWSKQRDGKWKIALDVGIENPEPWGAAA